MNLMSEQPSFLKQTAVQLAFGTSGLRGLAVDMTDLECYINTKAFIEYLIEINDISRGDTICIAGDLRPSTARILAAVNAAIENTRCKEENCGLIPTPALAYYAIKGGCASIMVTGSHIPKDRNGIKFYKHNSEVLKGDESGIAAHVFTVRKEEYGKSPDETPFNENGMFKEARSIGPVNRQAEEAYIRRYLDVFPSNCLSTQTLVLYQHSAVGRDILARILQRLGAIVITVSRSRKFKAIDTENMTAKDKNFLRSLAEKYKNRDIFAIVSTDGDGDRPVLASENGDLCRGDELGILVCEYLNAQFAAVPISANDSVDAQLGKNGVELVHTKIGSPYVIEAMNGAIARNKSHVVGWETNGGFLTGTDFIVDGKTLRSLPTRDACLPIICALELAINRHISMSQLLNELPRRYSDAGLIDNFPPQTSQEIMKYFSPVEPNNIQQVNFEFADIFFIDVDGNTVKLNKEDSTFKSLLRIKMALQPYFNPEFGFDNIVRINYTDGIKITFQNGDVAHLRPSGNAPQFRIYSNANSPERASEIVQLSVKGAGGIIQHMATDINKVR